VQLVEADGGSVFCIDMKPDGVSTCGSRGGFYAVEQLATCALAAQGWENFDGLDVGDGSIGGDNPLCDGEPGHDAVPLRDPGGCIGAINELPHVAAAEAKGRQETGLLDRVEGVKVCRYVEAVEHRKTLQDWGETE
jgi:hypothetical protein